MSMDPFALMGIIFSVVIIVPWLGYVISEEIRIRKAGK